MELTKLEDALLPYEKKLQAQERLRRFLGIKEVDHPTYERYFSDFVERFDRRKSARSALRPDNPFGEELRRRFKACTGYNDTDPLPYSELELEDRIGQSLLLAGFQLENEYHYETLPITPSGGRVEVTDKAWMTRLIKKVALMFGAEMVRITKVDRRWVYQDVNIPHQYAIVIVVSHIHSFINTSPSHFSHFSAGNTYSRLKFITTQLTDFIRGLGYDASCGPNYREVRAHVMEMLMVPTAIDAGVGEFARSGNVLSPEFGNNMRFKPVTTDLPLEVDKPVSFGVHEFCLSCENCAVFCPAHAVPFGPPTDIAPSIHNNPGFRKWYIDHERCLTFWAVNKKKWTSCSGRCIAVCPWNKPVTPFHNIFRWTSIHSHASFKKMLVWCDKMAYHRKKGIKTLK
jgi:reductive dehalogenase